MTVFVDTSALFALLDTEDPSHQATAGALAELRSTPLLTQSYVVIESVALTERRLGRDAARDLLETFVAELHVVHVDAAIHEAATSAYLASARRPASLVDHASFEVMRRFGIRRALAVDRDFADAGFQVIPA